MLRGGYDSLFFQRLTDPELDRGEVIEDFLVRTPLRPHFICTENDRHILISLDQRVEKPTKNRVLFTAHYDRWPGSPGANDNGAAVYHLLSYALRHFKEPGYRHTSVLLTDHEELGPGDSPADQGAARIINGLDHAADYQFYVFDMCGIGDTWAINTGTEQRLLRLSGRKGARTPLFNRLQGQRRETANLLLQQNHPFLYLHGLFSDDLGLLTRGIPAVQLSLVPGSYRENPPQGGIPAIWAPRHTLADRRETLDPQTLKRAADFLDSLAENTLPG